MTEKLLRRPEVEAVTGLSRASIYARMAKGDFPRPMRLGPRAVAWRDSDVQEWIDSLNPADPPAPGGRKPRGESRAAAG